MSLRIQGTSWRTILMVIDEVLIAMEMTVRMGVSGATGAVTASCSRDHLRSGDRGGENFIRQCPNIMPELEKRGTLT